MKGSWVAVVCLLLLVSVAAFSQDKKELSEAEAIRVAEEFVADNGYTDLSPARDKSKWKTESLEGAVVNVSLLKFRHNTLERGAIAVATSSWRGKSGSWLVIFHYNCGHQERLKTIPDYFQSCQEWGRVVTMDAYGERIRMEHQETKLDNPRFKKLAR